MWILRFGIWVAVGGLLAGAFIATDFTLKVFKKNSPTGKVSRGLGKN